MQTAIVPILLFAACAAGLAVALLVIGNLFNPRRPGRVKRMPYESGMDPIHDARRRFDVRFHLVAIAFLVFDVELLFLYPWAVAARPAEVTPAATAGEVAAGDAEGEEVAAASPVVRGASGAVGIDAAVARGSAEGYVESRDLVFAGAMLFIALLTVGFVYDWRKGIFQWR